MKVFYLILFLCALAGCSTHSETSANRINRSTLQTHGDIKKLKKPISRTVTKDNRQKSNIDPEVLRLMGEAWGANNDHNFEVALAKMQQAMELDTNPLRERHRPHIAFFLMQLGRHEEAVEHIRICKSGYVRLPNGSDLRIMTPKNALWYLKAYESATAVGDTALANEMIDSIVLDNDRKAGQLPYPDLRRFGRNVYLADAYVHESKHPGANYKEFHEKAYRLAPDNPYIMLHKVKFLVGQRRFEESVEFYHRVASLSFSEPEFIERRKRLKSYMQERRLIPGPPGVIVKPR